MTYLTYSLYLALFTGAAMYGYAVGSIIDWAVTKLKSKQPQPLTLSQKLKAKLHIG